MIAMATAMGIGRFVYTPILPGMMDGLGLSASEAGLIASANYFGYLVGAVLAAGGWAQGAERRILMGSLLLSAVLAAAMGLTDELWLFVTIRFVAGVASALMMIFLGTIVFSHLAAGGRNDLQALHFGGVGAGIALSGAMIGILYVVGAGWQAGWFWSAFLSLVGFAAVYVMIDRGPTGGSATEREPPLPNDPALKRIILAYGLFGFGYIITATFLVAIVREGEAGRLFESAVWVVTGLAGVPSVYLLWRLARRFGLMPVFVVGTIVEAIGVFASVSLGGYVGPLIGGVLLGGTFIAVTALGLQAGRVLAGSSPRRALALMTSAFGVGQIVGPVAAGYVADYTGDFVIASLGAAAALLLSAWVFWRAGHVDGRL